MIYKILTKNSTDNTNIDGARAEHFNAGMRDGIVKGAFNEGTFTTLASNEISFDTCELRISGHRVIIEEAWTRTFNSKPATPMRHALIGQIIVGEDSSVQFDLFPQLASTALIKNNLFSQQNGAGTYQVEIGRFTLNTDGNIIDVTRTLDIITGSKGEDLDGTINIGVVTTNTLEPEMDAEVDVEQRYDAEQKKVVTDFNFNIPRGKGLEDLDTELSESSTNAVQNNVITSAINNKADLTNDEQVITSNTNVVKKITIKKSDGTTSGEIYSDDSSLIIDTNSLNIVSDLRLNGNLTVDNSIINNKMGYQLDQTIRVTDQSKIFIPVDFNKYDYKLVMLLAPNQTEQNTSIRVANDGEIQRSQDRWLYQGTQTQQSNNTYQVSGYTHQENSGNGYMFLCENGNSVGKYNDIDVECSWIRDTVNTIIFKSHAGRSYVQSFAYYDSAGMLFNNTRLPNQLVVTSGNMDDANLLNGWIRVYKRLAFGQTE